MILTLPDISKQAEQFQLIRIFRMRNDGTHIPTIWAGTHLLPGGAAIVCSEEKSTDSHPITVRIRGILNRLCIAKVRIKMVARWEGSFNKKWYNGLSGIATDKVGTVNK